MTLVNEKSHIFNMIINNNYLGTRRCVRAWETGPAGVGGLEGSPYVGIQAQSHQILPPARAGKPTDLQWKLHATMLNLGRSTTAIKAYKTERAVRP
jgi:hypothetical protein